MSQILFEQYKEALRRGHTAAAAGRLEAAATAYEAAAAIAPDRALPYTSLGDVLRRLGRQEASERAYGDALQRSPRDEGALRGRASLRLELRRPLDAAHDLEGLAESLEYAGRLSEACEAACDALEIAESRDRRRIVERLVRQLSAQDGDPRAAAALARAAAFVVVTPVAEPDASAGDVDTPASGSQVAVFDAVVARVEAERLVASGAPGDARPLLISIAASEREAGRLDGAMDACFILMSIDPADPAVQLEIAANQVARGWLDLARDKVTLLSRLAELDAIPSVRSDANSDVSPDARALIDAFARDHGFELPPGIGDGSPGISA